VSKRARRGAKRVQRGRREMQGASLDRHKSKSRVLIDWGYREGGKNSEIRGGHNGGDKEKR